MTYHRRIPRSTHSYRVDKGSITMTFKFSSLIVHAPSVVLRAGIGCEFWTKPDAYSTIKFRPKRRHHPSTCTLMKLMPVQGFFSLHLMMPGGRRPPCDVIFTKVIFATVINGYVSQCLSNG